MTTLILAASPSQANWDQANAFEEGQQRVAIGKDPMPGPRSCFWRYGPVSGDPYINIAFPDAASTTHKVFHVAIDVLSSIVRADEAEVSTFFTAASVPDAEFERPR